MNLESVKKEIVSHSIKSAICIDDEFVEPYEEFFGNKRFIDKPKQLRASFRKNCCSLDIYKYKDYEQLKDEAEYVFNNRDLLILDWELSDSAIKFEDALCILKDAVVNPGLAFGIIYTHTDDLDDIEIQIRSYFNQKAKSVKEREDKYIQLCGKLDEEFFDNYAPKSSAESFFKDMKIKDALNSLFNQKTPSEQIEAFETAIKDYFNKAGKIFFELFEKNIREIYECDSLTEACEQLTFYFRNTFISASPFRKEMYCHKIHDQSHALWISNTYIIILNKEEFMPERVYEKLSDSICQKPGNIMSLIALEMKNNFRDNSSKIGKELLAIDELAFFHHRRTLLNLDNPEETFPDEEFYDFLRNNWKHQVSSFYLNSDSRVLSLLNDYITNSDINNKINEKLKSGKEEFLEELAKLNFQYSFNHKSRRENDYIRFGDIFSRRKYEGQTETVEYFLNITAHCDCLRPKGIDFNYHFIKGTYDDNALESRLKKVTDEKKCFSFLRKNNKSFCIEWKTKPFTINIPERKRFFSSNDTNSLHIVEVLIGKEEVSLYYEGALLENYAQRISNIAFSHAARVGIDLVGYNKKK